MYEYYFNTTCTVVRVLRSKYFNFIARADDTNISNNKRKKRKFKSDPLAQAKQEAERRRTEQQEVITQKAHHQANESEKQHQRKVRAKKRMQRTKKGQPIMKNVIGDLLGKIKSDNGG